VNESILAKLVVTVVVLIGFTVWLALERRHSHGCQINLLNRFFGQPQVDRDSG
jgi:hypothetical protein